MAELTVRGNLVDVLAGTIYEASISVQNNRVTEIEKHAAETNHSLPYILPGFIDSHVHIESSMLIPSEFARMAVVHGTIGTVSDPHEIANVCGVEGVDFMIRNGKRVPFHFHFGAPSCVPATVFETAGAAISVDDIQVLMSRPEIKYLSEMMNFPGVLNNDPAVMDKIRIAHANNKPVDGHAPGLRGAAARKYIEAGISTDHECFTEEEAREKLELGMKIIIREGSAARNFEALIPLLHEYPDQIMFCSDDKHPDSLEAGHINLLCARAVERGVNIFHILKAACINPVKHYKLDTGFVNENDPANFILVEDLKSFRVLETYVNGMLVARDGKSLINRPEEPPVAINNFDCKPIIIADLDVPFSNHDTIPVIEALDGQLITNRLNLKPLVSEESIVSDTNEDILKLVVINRYTASRPAIAFIRNFGLKSGALASSVAHDSHNIVAVGVDDASIVSAVNRIIDEKGGISLTDGTGTTIIPLPVAGLMSTEDGYKVSAMYTEIDRKAKALGCQLGSPFMTLSFMALLVIPHLKLSDKGLFDGDDFSFIDWI